MLQNYRNFHLLKNLHLGFFFHRVFHRTFSLYFWTAFLDFCVFVFVSPVCPPLYYFAREHWWYCVTVFFGTDWLNVSLLLFQIWYLANQIFRSLFPNTQGAVTRFNPYEFLVAPIALGKCFVLLRFVKSISISCLLWISVKVVGLIIIDGKRLHS